MCSLCMAFVGYKRSSARQRPGEAVSQLEEIFQKWLGFVHGTEKSSAGSLAKEHVQLGTDLIAYLVSSKKHLGCLLCRCYHSNLSRFSWQVLGITNIFKTFCFFPQLFFIQQSSLFSMEVLNKLQQGRSPNKHFLRCFFFTQMAFVLSHLPPCLTDAFLCY